MGKKMLYPRTRPGFRGIKLEARAIRPQGGLVKEDSPGAGLKKGRASARKNLSRGYRAIPTLRQARASALCSGFLAASFCPSARQERPSFI